MSTVNKIFFHMKEQEGVIKYQLDHAQKPVGEPFSFREINAWRTVVYRLGLIGQDPRRYGGLGFGNISHRIDARSERFMISGSQTGHIEQLRPEHYCLIMHADSRNNRIESRGLHKPSSESLTHAGIYALDSAIQAVIHVHSPEIWNHAAALDLPDIAADISYGTVEMALAVERLFQSGGLQRTPLFTMRGHEDGVVAFGKTLAEAAGVLINMLALAIGIEQQ
jgi:ribulose-5-phosphate 4-epimerase/fuculose-1-phosphate aldolase